ncbi:MAG TPA: cobalamin-dependent protein, partial [Anaerolineaceae bacterium]|nr:cobalamin-dependent protein [Anaerolineaceae bacterium]
GEAIREGKGDVLAMSALLTTTMTNMKITIESLKEAGLRNQVKVVVGGAPLTDRYAHDIGADGYAPDANQAVRMIQAMIG